MSDPFASNWLSLLMAWICSLPILASSMLLFIRLVVTLRERLPLWFILWTGACFFLLSPFLYVLLQGILLVSFPWQSWRAFFSSFLLVFYVPHLLFLMAAVGVGLPLYLLSKALGKEEEPRPLNLALAAVVNPLACITASAVFFAALPYLGNTVKWLKAEDMMQATNGPAYVLYRFASVPLRYVVNRDFRFKEVHRPKTKKEVLRNHVATLYLSEDQHLSYLLRIHPRLEQQMESYPEREHFHIWDQTTTGGR